GEVLGAERQVEARAALEALAVERRERLEHRGAVVAQDQHLGGALGQRRLAAADLASARIAARLDRRADALSGGMYKKLALSCALLHQPKVLLLDEPTNGVDPVSRRELWELIYELVAGGMAVLVSTPYMDEASRCHRVGLMYRGRILAEGAPSELTASLEQEVYEVMGGDRVALQAQVASIPDVIAASPAGARLRIVVTPGRREAVERTTASLGAELVRVAPDFEDLFLARIHAQEEAA
ncbi:partial putative multidrug ABC transporter ATP-binding protein YbhF, partial [Anaerolineae bacterium]